MTGTPVLITAFRRPAATAAVLQAVSMARPSRLFVSVDAPRADRPDDAIAVRQTVARIHEAVTWPCDLAVRQADINRGLRSGMTAAIDWFFSNVDEGIILEDDCVPHPDFFPYCAELLHRYRDDARVMCISGDNSAGVRSVLSPRASYFFLPQPLIWGWATWRSAWEKYDRDLRAWIDVRDSPEKLRAIFPDKVERKILSGVFDKMVERRRPDSWAFPWTWTVALSGGLSAIPRTNLVTNIGFGDAATHTLDGGDPRSDVATASIMPLRHPRRIRRDRIAARWMVDRIYGGRDLRRSRALHRRIVASVRYRTRTVISMLRVSGRDQRVQ